MTSCLLCCGQVQQFGGMDVDGVEIGACKGKKTFEDGILSKDVAMISQFSIDKNRVAKSELTKL